MKLKKSDENWKCCDSWKKEKAKEEIRGRRVHRWKLWWKWKMMKVDCCDACWDGLIWNGIERMDLGNSDDDDDDEWKGEKERIGRNEVPCWWKCGGERKWRVAKVEEDSVHRIQPAHFLCHKIYLFF